MPTQKTFKRRVRARMTKTGESYTTARGQLMHKSGSADKAPAATAATAATDAEGTPIGPEPTPTDAVELPSSDTATVKATGRTYVEWFALLDGWGATERTHTEIARWLRDDHAVDGWWAQNVTVAYERARGLRAKHQMPGGFAVGVSRTIGVDAATALAAFTDLEARECWLPGAPLTRRRSTAANVARFDWADPPSRLVVSVDPKGARTTVWVSHERLADAAMAEVQKAAWRQRLAALKAALEGAAR